MWRAVAVLALALLTGGTSATQASAQEEGVYLDDPDSPGGKEYSIPHSRARREAGPGGPTSRTDPPRFGAGIEPQDGGPSAGEEDAASGVAGDSGSGANGSEAGGAIAEGPGGGSAGASEPRAGSMDDADSGSRKPTYNASSSSGAGPELQASAIALGVLLAGTALGLLLRRFRRGSSG